MLVIKRDGREVEFDPSRIVRAMLMAFNATQPGRIPDMSPLLQRVCSKLIKEKVTVDEVGNAIETVLVESGFIPVARNFIRYRAERDTLRLQRLPSNPAILSRYIHASKYARSGESWDDTVSRVAEMHDCDGDWWTYVREMKVLPSMRSLQFGGRAILRHNARMYNCSYTVIDGWHKFGEILYLLLCGCGVGFNVKWVHIDKLPPLPKLKGVVHHHIGDSIEGWAEAVNRLIFESSYVEFDYSQIRPEGSPLITSGGIAPGHLGLKRMLENVRTRLDVTRGRKIRPIEVHDIICELAMCVLSGGIRRSSLISLFDPRDTEMLYAKTTFDPHGVRAMANNSVHNPDPDTYRKALKLAIDGYGEPGFYFAPNDRMGCNPCGEILLDSFGFCNLTEINCSTCDSKAEFLTRCKMATIIGTLQARFSSIPVRDNTCERDALLGVSLTGIYDNLKVLDWLRDGYEVVRETNKEWAPRVRVNQAVRVTCVKPSGTASLLLNCSSGCHPRYARRYFRRITANPNEPLAQQFRAANPHMVEVKPNGDWCLVFPVEAPDSAITLRDVSTQDHLAVIKRLQQEWADHSVSATLITDSPETVDVTGLRCLSFAPPLLEQKYPFAPLQAVTTEADEARWNELIKLYKEPHYVGHAQYGSACTKDSCEM